MRVQDAPDGRASDLVVEIPQRAPDARIARVRVLVGHSQNELDNDLGNPWSSRAASLATVVHTGHQFPMPAQNRVRRDDARDLRQHFPGYRLALHSQAPALGTGEAESLALQLLSQDAILCNQELYH